MVERMERSWARKIELRSKEGAELPTIFGYAAVFEQPSELLYNSWHEIIDPHYFDAALKSPDVDIRFFGYHNKEKPVARYCPSKGIDSLKVGVDEHGFWYEFTPIKTSYAMDMVEQIRSRVLDACSIGHYVAQDDWSGLYKSAPLRRLLVCEKVEDMSIVTYPAWPTTEISLRSIGGPMTEAEARALLASKQAPKTVPLSIREKQMHLRRLDG